MIFPYLIQKFLMRVGLTFVVLWVFVLLGTKYVPNPQGIFIMLIIFAAFTIMDVYEYRMKYPAQDSDDDYDSYTGKTTKL